RQPDRSRARLRGAVPAAPHQPLPAARPRAARVPGAAVHARPRRAGARRYHAPESGNMNGILDRRRAGVLLHPTSLPSGDLGSDVERLLDFMVAAGLSVWQTLPLGPTHADRSPY